MKAKFFYDLGSPYAYLTATRIDDAFGADVEVEWVPVLLGAIFLAAERGSWAETPARKAGMQTVERRAEKLKMPKFKWPEPWPNNGLAAMRIATWAHREGFGREFAMAAFYEQFVAGRPLSEGSSIKAAAERAGLSAAAALAAARDSEIKEQLRDNTAMAIAAGVIGVPTIVVGGQLFWGDDRLDEAVGLAVAG